MNNSEGIYIIAPFYNNPNLVETLALSLFSCIDELRDLKCKFIFINDSPNNLQLGNELKKWIQFLADKGIAGDLINNSENLGFIKSTNKGLLLAIKNSCDALLLNSDAILYPGCIREIVDVALTDEMIGFVSPRSNEAGLSTIPHLATSAKKYLSREDGLKSHAIISAWLPRVTFAPTAVGFCLFIKNKIIREFGVLDEIYGKGYNEENDLILRANRFGYRAALANYAYCWHEGSVSFGKASYISAEEENGKILNERFPEYKKIVQAHYSSPSYKSENILSGLLCGSDEGVKHIALNLSNIGPNYNGTAEMAVNISKKLSENKEIRLHLIAEEATAKFHGFARYGYIDQPHSDRRYAAMIHMGQPFRWDDVFTAANRAPINAYFMLDTIAQDCGYLYNPSVDKIWQFIAQNADAIFFISQHSKDLFNNRFEVSQNVSQVVSLLPTTADAYVKTDVQGTRHILVVGNHYAHKSIPEAVEVLSTSFPTKNIIVLGTDSSRHFHNVTFIKSGLIENSVVESLYAQAEIVIFPSHYEGFGFPMVKAVAYGKPVVVRKSALVDEILAHLPENHNVKLFSFTDEIPETITQCHLNSPGISKDVTPINWDDVAHKIMAEINALINSPDRGIKIRRRLFALSLIVDKIENSEYSNELNKIYKSKSWRLTKPLRFANKIYKDIVGKINL